MALDLVIPLEQKISFRYGLIVLTENVNVLKHKKIFWNHIEKSSAKPKSMFWNINVGDADNFHDQDIISPWGFWGRFSL